MTGSGTLVVPESGGVGRVKSTVLYTSESTINYQLSGDKMAFTLTAGTYKSSALGEYLTLTGEVIRSDDPRCPALLKSGARRAVVFRIGDAGGKPGVGDGIQIQVEGCPGHSALYGSSKAKSGVTVVIQRPVRCTTSVAGKCPFPPTPAGSPGKPPTPTKPTEPTQLTLVVNGTSATWAAGKPEPAYPVVTLAPGTDVQILAKLDHALPSASGWSFYVDRSGDPKSPGNGVYYHVCDTKAGGTTCGPVTRPGNPPGSPGESVCARLNSDSAGEHVGTCVGIAWKSS